MDFIYMKMHRQINKTGQFVVKEFFLGNHFRQFYFSQRLFTQEQISFQLQSEHISVRLPVSMICT